MYLVKECFFSMYLFRNDVIRQLKFVKLVSKIRLIKRNVFITITDTFLRRKIKLFEF
jgi:hypothetical protein